MVKKIISIALILFQTSTFCFSENPVIKNIGMSDPHVRIFNDTLYLYTGHDSSATDKTWIMKEWRIFRTTDLLHWEQVGKVSPTENYMDNNSTDCWACDASERDGKYYFYFSDRKRGIGVMQSDSPAGPFTDALGKALISPMHDPTVFIDDDPDKTPYIIYGDKEGGGFHVVKLNNDMISLAEKPKPVKIEGEEWENAPLWMDKNYLFKYNSKYYLSWGRDYAVSENIYGPYQCAGSVGTGHNLDEFAHGSFFEWKGQYYHIWCYYINPPYKYRESIITYCHRTEDGKIVSDTKFLDSHFENGVGQYISDWPVIEAEWYYEKNGEIKKQSIKNGGIELTNIYSGNWLRFANMDFKNPGSFTAHIKFQGKTTGKVEVRLDSPDGNLLQTIEIIGGESYQTVSAPLKYVKGKRDVFLKFTGNKNNEFKLDWFKFY